MELTKSKQKIALDKGREKNYEVKDIYPAEDNKLADGNLPEFSNFPASQVNGNNQA